MKEEKPLIILDTDMDTDCDDAGALAMLLEYQKRGRAELLGIITDSVSPYAAPCCEVLMKEYGVKCPIGALDAQFEAGTHRLEAYRLHSEKMSRYNREVSKETGKTGKEYPSETEGYRRCLASAPDQSVTVVCIGLLTALANTLLSEGDEFSPLSGVELFQKKVKKVITMGTPEKTNDFNWGMDALASEVFFRLCPVPVCISEEGTKIITGKTLAKTKSPEHPLRRIYQLYAKDHSPGRSSWDLVALLYALEPKCGMFREENRGRCRFDAETNRSYWERENPRGDTEIFLTQREDMVEEYLEKRMIGDF